MQQGWATIIPTVVAHRYPNKSRLIPLHTNCVGLLSSFGNDGITACLVWRKVASDELRRHVLNMRRAQMKRDGGESPSSLCYDSVPQPKAPTLKLAARAGGFTVPWALIKCTSWDMWVSMMSGGWERRGFRRAGVIGVRGGWSGIGAPTVSR